MVGIWGLFPWEGAVPIGILFWLLWIFWVLALIFGSSYPYVSAGFLAVVLGLLGWEVFGAPLRKGS
jgi:hypothetical protein